MKTNKIDLNKLHKTLCLILQQLDSYFSLHDIDYSLTGGNLIGAIRHNGFIPWDDDMDIIMTRDNYERFKHFWQLQGIEGLSIEFECGDTFHLNHTKIFKDGTIFSSKDEMKKNHHHGVWIDLFVLDKIPINLKERKKMIKCAKKRILFTRNKIFKKGSFFQMVVSMIVLLIPRRIKQRIIKKCNSLILKFNQINSDYQFIELAAPNLLNYFYDKELVSGGYCYHDYDDFSFKIFTNYEIFLKERFGDYTKLPPLEERVCKHMPEIVDFGDSNV